MLACCFNDVVWLECASVGFISLNWTRYCDEERDALMYEQRSIDDRDRRVEIWHEVQEMMRDAYTHIFFNHANWTIGAREEVHNVCGQTAPAKRSTTCAARPRPRRGPQRVRPDRAREEVHNVCGQTAPADGTKLFCNNQGRGPTAPGLAGLMASGS